MSFQNSKRLFTYLLPIFDPIVWTPVRQSWRICKRFAIVPMQNENFGKVCYNWHLEVLVRVLKKLSFFLRKRLIWREAGKHIAASCGRCCPVRETSKITCLCLQTWQAQDHLTARRGPAFPLPVEQVYSMSINWHRIWYSALWKTDVLCVHV